ncbi:hypothetical protein N5J77_16795 [Sphingobium yanoikuyae]|uniref:Uncharacterized protein n=1 Tax=Sphingobium yanoikuyae TaxID=13690 RepID=A0AA42WYR5_SPHYA|nr:hypothetical protein [Sphingobium yanoikuyae]MDH2132787.1 hypothetical protein [Sphingobium yanoikuyae]MDH2151815.1 hypothetical protein [Sphingobium yanoikuyae]MDH2167962.1 hypothetical protein [Sphingobium yanoikuyae]
MQTNAVYDHSAFLAALHAAQRRAANSYFDQHILEDRDGGFISIDQGDYAALPQPLIDRIAYTIRGSLVDEM